MSLHIIYKNAFAAMNAQQGHMAAVIKRQKEAGKLIKNTSLRRTKPPTRA